MTCRLCESAQLTPLWTDADGCKWARCRSCGSDSNRDASYARTDYGASYVKRLRADEGINAFANHEHNGDAYGRHGAKPGRFLDVGTGHGVSGDVMYSYGWDVTRFDICADGRPAGTVIAPDFRASLFPEPFDAVLAREVLEHVADPKRLLEELRDVTKRGGLCQLTTPRPIEECRYEVYQRYHLLIWSPEALQRELRSIGFKVMEFEPWALGQRYMLRRL